jgi:DNA-binding GntR family transcriptional regulator
VSPRSRAASGPGGVPERRDVYERLADELRADIASGRYAPGDRLPSTLDLMERTGVANLTVRGAYRVLVEEGLVESVPKRGFYVRRPSAMAWHMTYGGTRKARQALDGWELDAVAAGLEPVEELSVAIEDAGVLVAGRPAGERLGLAPGSRVLVRRAIRYLRPPGRAGLPGEPAGLADEYYAYDLVRDTSLASPVEASAFEVLAGVGQPLAGHRDELRPRVATAEERRLLALPQVSVVLELARTARTAEGTPVVVLHQVRRGDGAIYHYDITYPRR